MRLIKAYLAYVNDNPKGYWFRRKLYGWGWTPATKEGWLTTVTFLCFILLVAIRADAAVLTETEVLWQVVLPLIIATVVFLVICYKTGESPRWQWRIPSKYFK